MTTCLTYSRHARLEEDGPAPAAKTGHDNACKVPWRAENARLAHHRQQGTELARVAASDKDVKLLMTIPGVNVFTAVAMKARIGDVSCFPTKKHPSSYAGAVPRANNSGDYVSQHNHVKHGDAILKYTLTYSYLG